MGSVDRKKMVRGNAFKQNESANRQAVSGRISAAQSYQLPNPVLIGSSDLFSSLLDTLESIAHRHCCVMITGETGTGKEMVARKIHYHSNRAQSPFIPVDCTTLTGQLFESQLFGHVKGAFTGAIHDTLGFFRAADGGTIFLDEISEIPPDLQAKLLRVLQESTVTPIGSTQSHPVDVRVLCAVNRDLHEMVKKNEFRADLFYRINVVNLEIPPLRQRLDDILPLANHFLNNQAMFYDEPAKKLSARAEQLLLKYHWPGNVREVANAMERAYVLSVTEMIEPSALPKEILTSAYTTQPGSPLPTLDDAQSKLIAEALRLTEGKKVATAKILGIDRRRLNRLIEKLNITVPTSGK
ncbi:MAG: sigma-54 interaction domain-containing protein [Planctomycetota bacterium]|jgi:transcriptional regulator with PAS, ATPase and Fis domain